jgi:hypothetical protein
MALLDVLKTDETVKGDSDSVGGFSILDSGVYPMKVKLAYITLSKGKAMALNTLLEGTKKEQLRAQFYLTGGEAKGCKNYYIDKKTKEKKHLPGFNMANSLCEITLGEQIGNLNTEKKTINLYDYELKKETPTEVDMIMPLIGKEVYAGVINQVVDKRAKDPNSGEYMPTEETRTENEVDKFFRASDKLTSVEIAAGETTPVFMGKWKDRWDGEVRNKASKTGIKKGAPAAKRQTGKQAPTTELFN